MRPAIVRVRAAKSSSVGVVSALRYQPGESLDGGRDRTDDVEEVRDMKLGRLGEWRPVMLMEVLGTMYSISMAVLPFRTSEVVFILCEPAELQEDDLDSRLQCRRVAQETIQYDCCSLHRVTYR